MTLATGQPFTRPPFAALSDQRSVQATMRTKPTACRQVYTALLLHSEEPWGTAKCVTQV
jgi:hypothetical protein